MSRRRNSPQPVAPQQPAVAPQQPAPPQAPPGFQLNAFGAGISRSGAQYLGSAKRQDQHVQVRVRTVGIQSDLRSRCRHPAQQGQRRAELPEARQGQLPDHRDQALDARAGRRQASSRRNLPRATGCRKRTPSASTGCATANRCSNIATTRSSSSSGPSRPQLQGKAIVDGPLPFLFGAEAKKLKERYWLKVDSQPKQDPNQIWLDRPAPLSSPGRQLPRRARDSRSRHR